MTTTHRLKRANGRYYTTGNPFEHEAFLHWAKSAKLKKTTILEPFAGANDLIHRLKKSGLCNRFQSYDIEPSGPDVEQRDTLASFPSGYDVCITNPPWLAKNSASVRGLAFPDTPYDDLYKFALEKCIQHCEWVAALIPESFIRANLFRERLTNFISLTTPLFEETGHPAGLALFSPYVSMYTDVWSGDQWLGRLNELEATRPCPKPGGIRIRFNEPEGNVGLIALDNTTEASIRFCDPAELRGYRIKKSGRHITKLIVDGPVRIADWNRFIDRFRERTGDVLMTCYKGMRKDGKYRRRLDWSLARGIIHAVG